jgi:hypothetical protein
MLIQSVTFQTGQASIAKSSPTTLDLTTFNYVMYFSGFRIQGWSNNCGFPSITLTTSQYTVNLSVNSGISSSTFQILFYNNDILLKNHRFNVTFHSFDQKNSSFDYTSTNPSTNSNETLIYGLRTVKDHHNSFMNMQTTVNSPQSFHAALT